MRKYSFFVVICLFIIGTGTCMFIRDEVIAKKAESIKWKKIDGDSSFEKGVSLQVVRGEGDKEIAYELSPSGIRQLSLKQRLFQNVPVEEFYKENETTFNKYKSFFRGQDKQGIESYFWDGTILAYADVKNGFKDKDQESSFSYLQLKSANTKNGVVKEAEVALNQYGFENSRVLDVQVMKDTLYVMVGHSRSSIYVYEVFSFDAHTLKQIFHQLISLPPSKHNGYSTSLPITSETPTVPSSTYMIYESNSGFESGNNGKGEFKWDNILISWDYKKGDFIDLSEQLNKFSYTNTEIPFRDFSSNRIADNNVYSIFNDKGVQKLIRLEKNRIKEITLEQPKFGSWERNYVPQIRNQYMYVIGINEDEKQALFVFDLKSGKKVYEALLPNSSEASINGLYVK